MAGHTDFSLFSVATNAAPEYQVTMAPIVRRSREVWMVYSDLGNMHADVCSAKYRRQAAELVADNSCTVSGRVLAVVGSAARAIGWQVATYHTLVDDRGVVIQLDKCTPKGLKTLLCESL